LLLVACGLLLSFLPADSLRFCVSALGVSLRSTSKPKAEGGVPARSWLGHGSLEGILRAGAPASLKQVINLFSRNFLVLNKYFPYSVNNDFVYAGPGV
jgi:hypothetical protein